jgi:hypothetical protein
MAFRGKISLVALEGDLPAGESVKKVIDPKLPIEWMGDPPCRVFYFGDTRSCCRKPIYLIAKIEVRGIQVAGTPVPPEGLRISLDGEEMVYPSEPVGIIPGRNEFRGAKIFDLKNTIPGTITVTALGTNVSDVKVSVELTFGFLDSTNWPKQKDISELGLYGVILFYVLLTLLVIYVSFRIIRD